MTKALATGHVSGARARICTFQGSPGRLGRVGISVGAVRLDRCKRLACSGSRQRYYGNQFLRTD